MTADPVRRTYWVFTDQSLFEIVVGNEDRDVWKVYLEKGHFDTALRFSKVCWDSLELCLELITLFGKTAYQRDRVLSAQANAYFKEARYFQAAQCYAQCSTTFEEVVLRFLDVGERDALRSYLISRLERTKKAVRSDAHFLLISAQNLYRI